jgi:hypothetical protein
VTDNPAAPDFPSSPLNRRIVTTRPAAARIWNYWLGGGDYYEVDRKAGDEIRRLYPSIGDYARADRQFLGRAVRHLAAEVGIRQFLDIGAGLPTAENTHEVAQHIAPDSRIVYVDNDPLVLVHARALLTSAPEGRTDHVDEDLRNVDSVLAHAARTLDLTHRSPSARRRGSPGSSTDSTCWSPASSRARAGGRTTPAIPLAGNRRSCPCTAEWEPRRDGKGHGQGRTSRTGRARRTSRSHAPPPPTTSTSGSDRHEPDVGIPRREPVNMCRPPHV